MDGKVKENIYDLISRVQKELKAPKSKWNKFGEYHYRSLEDILEGVKALLPSGSYVIFNDEIIMIGDRFYVKATASLCYQEKCVSSAAYAREDSERKKMHPEQLTGCASSYARKNALNGLFCIDDTKDADADELKAEIKKQEPTEKPKLSDTQKWLAEMKKKLGDCKTPEQVIELTRSNQRGDLSENQVKWYNEEIKITNERVSQAPWMRSLNNDDLRDLR